MIYFIQDTSSRSIKIGTSGRPLARLADLQTAHHAPLILIGVMEGAQHEERELHSKFERLRGEWFEPSRALLAYIQNNAITPQSMGHLPSTSFVVPLPTTSAQLVGRLCVIRDALLLVILWAVTATATVYTVACLVLIARDGDWPRIGWFFLGMLETSAFAIMSTHYRKRITNPEIIP